MLYLLIGITFLFIMINFKISNYDYLHPAPLFCFTFFICELLCAFCAKKYWITFHPETVLVISIALFTFTIVHLLCQIQYKKKENKFKSNVIYVDDFYVKILIIMQIICILFFIKYLMDLSIAYNANYAGKVSTITDMISLYDTMTKFWTQIYNDLNVPIPLIYRIFNPICLAGAYLLIYIMVNNFVINKSLNKLHLLSFILLIILILLNGSRTPLFRILTMILILIYIMKIKNKRHSKANLYFFIKLICIIIISLFVFISILDLMGRDADFSFSEYVFTYLGAPLYNLDSVLSSSNHINNANIWGQQSFKGLYSFFYKISGQEKNIIDNINVFNFSRNGIETGNVYTTFYPFYYDFGYIGIMPLIMVIALYYINNYKLLIQDKRQKMSLINFRLFIFSYLYNDLIMLVFSNRFYGTIFDISFIKMIIIAWLLKSICIDREFRINKYILKLKRIRIGK